jgi:ferric-dicitrate binding protein FerR (iron transport regulator)
VLIGAAAVIVLAGTVAAVLHKRAQAAAAREPRALHLSDGTEAYFRGDTVIEPAAAYPAVKDIHVDGDVFIQLPDGAGPWKVRTRLLVLTVDGGSAFRITAYSKQTGEQVEVVRGRMEARKSYPSPYAVPDQLGPGEMVMINRTIDLMEKERTNAEDVRRWGEALKAEFAARKASVIPD